MAMQLQSSLEISELLGGRRDLFTNSVVSTTDICMAMQM